MNAGVRSDEERHRRIVSPVPVEGRPYQGRRAGVVSRLVASLVDAVVVVFAVVAGYLGVSGVKFLWAPSRFAFPRVDSGVLLGIGAVVTFGYLTWAWATTGRTYGDHVIGLRVVNYRGDRVRLAGAAARAALCVVFPIGLLFALVSGENRSLQDIVLRTSVIYDWLPTRGWR